MSKQKLEQKTPAFIAYVVREQKDNSYWNRIGVAWQHEDKEGFTLHLDALPVDGRIILRVRKDSDEQDGGKK